MDRRTFIASVTAAAAGSVALPEIAWSQSDWERVLQDAQEEGEVVLYSSGIARVEEGLMARFTSDTGVQVRYSRPGGGEIVLRRFEQELQGGAPVADVCTLTDNALGMHAVAQGWVATPELPNASNLSPAFGEVRDGIFPTGGFGLTIVVNDTLFPDGDAPVSYKDLTEERFKGQVLFGAPENAGSTTLWIKAMVEQYGWDYVEALRANEASEMRLQAEAMQAVARGEKGICVVAQSWGYQFKQQGAPVSLIFPEDGVVFAQTCLFVANNAPNPKAAALLANAILSPEYQQAVGAMTGSYGSNRDTPPPDGVPPLGEIEIYTPNLEELVATRGEIIGQWRRIMG